VRLLAVAAAALAAAAVAGLARSGRPPAMPAVVTVEAGSERATGFTRGARVVTVAHLLGARAAIRVRDGNGPARPATVVRADAVTDLALLDAPGLRATPAPPVGGISVLVRRGDGVVALPAVLRRRITARLRGAGGEAGPRRPALELAVDVLPGDSGAPVLAPGGRLLGVLFARSNLRASTAYAVDALP
jgi:S1-C subfamily serine protease